jgi:hypothetical protein
MGQSIQLSGNSPRRVQASGCQRDLFRLVITIFTTVSSKLVGQRYGAGVRTGVGLLKSQMLAIVVRLIEGGLRDIIRWQSWPSVSFHDC